MLGFFFRAREYGKLKETRSWCVRKETKPGYPEGAQEHPGFKIAQPHAYHGGRVG
jgi:hypothetical protein